MKRARGGAAARKRREDGAVKRGTRVKDNFTFAFGAAEFGESAHKGRKIIVGGGEKNDVGGENGP
jgi:hypothetical protein